MRDLWREMACVWWQQPWSVDVSGWEHEGYGYGVEGLWASGYDGQVKLWFPNSADNLEFPDRTEEIRAYATSSA